MLLLTILVVVYIVYIDSGLFILTSTIYRDALDINISYGHCTQATNMCTESDNYSIQPNTNLFIGLIFYMTSKIFVYLYFVERCVSFTDIS
jgi:hypothetical protein